MGNFQYHGDFASCVSPALVAGDLIVRMQEISHWICLLSQMVLRCHLCWRGQHRCLLVWVLALIIYWIGTWVVFPSWHLFLRPDCHFCQGLATLTHMGGYWQLGWWGKISREFLNGWLSYNKLFCYYDVIFLFRAQFHPGMSRAFFLPFECGRSILPPRFGPLTKEESIRNQLRKRRLEETITKLRKEKESLRVEIGEFPVLHIPDEKLLSWCVPIYMILFWYSNFVYSFQYLWFNKQNFW